MNMNHKMTPDMKKEIRRKLHKNTNAAKHFQNLSKDPDGFKKGLLNEIGKMKGRGELLATAVTILCIHILAEQKGFSLLDDIELDNKECGKTILELIRAMKVLGVIFDLDGYALHNKMLATLADIFDIPPEMIKKLYDGIGQIPAPVAQSG